MFMFKGEERDENTPETTTQEINNFIVQNLPQNATSTKVFSYPDYLISTKKSVNGDM